MATPAVRSFAAVPAVKDEEKTTTLPAGLQAGGEGWSSAMALATAGIIFNQEMYVVNDETMLMASWLGLMFVFVKGGSGSVAEMLDTRAAAIEAELAEQRVEEQTALGDMLKKAEDAIAVNKELVGICSPANFEEWTTFKMTKTLQMHQNEAALQTLAKVEAIKRFEEQSARRKMTALVTEVNDSVEAAIMGNDALKKSSIDDAIAGIKGA
eukprot:SAG22_NODE_2683_length_2312_cov_1.609128_1_plen_211_part_00